MLHSVQTWNGHNINDGTNYQAVLLNPHGVPTAKPVFLDQQDADSIDAGTFTVDVATKVLTIRIMNYANRYNLIAQLKTWFKRGTEGNLVVQFVDDGISYQMECRSIDLIQDDERSSIVWRAILNTGASTWRAVTETTIPTWTVTDTETLDIDVGGKDESYLSAEITVTGGPAGGWLYQKLIQLINSNMVAHGVIPYCFTVDTAALVTAGKMRSDCNDLRIVDLFTGIEYKRWITDKNTSSTKVWVNLNFGRGFLLRLGTSLSNAGVVTELQIVVTQYAKDNIAKMPKVGFLVIDNEWFYYTNTDPVNCKITITYRGVFGTPQQSHTGGTSGALIYYIQYPLLMKYGNLTASDPASEDTAYDVDKPLINLTSSTNTSWVWDATTGFTDLGNPARTAGWTPSYKRLGGYSYPYYWKQLSGSDPAMGDLVGTYLSGASWKAENVVLTWTFRHAAGITSVSMTGEKFRSNANWLLLAGLRRSTDNVNFYNLWTEASPGTVSTWTSWTHNSVSVSPTSQILQLIFSGGYPAAANAYAAFGALTCTISINAGAVPANSLLGEVSNYPMDLKMENLTTGDAIALNYQLLIGKKFVLDGETRVITYDGANAYGAVTVDDPGRSDLIRLVGNATNQIRISGSDVGTITVDLRFFARRL